MKTSQNACAEELGLDAILPNGFLARTGDKGLVVINWVPQPEILSHDFVGNSALEAVVAGVQCCDSRCCGGDSDGVDRGCGRDDAWWTNPGIPGRHVAGDKYPGRHVARDKPLGKARKGFFPGRQGGAHIVLVKHLSVTVEGFPGRHVARDNAVIKKDLTVIIV
ncbi:hypothetical protein Tco_0539828 [Tanacetum coccineum]